MALSLRQKTVNSWTTTPQCLGLPGVQDIGDSRLSGIPEEGKLQHSPVSGTPAILDSPLSWTLEILDSPASRTPGNLDSPVSQMPGSHFKIGVTLWKVAKIKKGSRKPLVPSWLTSPAELAWKLQVVPSGQKYKIPKDWKKLYDITINCLTL